MTTPYITAVLATITSVRAEKFNEEALESLVSHLLFTFSSVRALVFQGTNLALSPARLTWSTITWLYRNGVIGITHLTSHPVVPFLLTAIGCGLVIGGCAGFAVEACTSMLLSATWGKPTQQPAITQQDDEDDASVSADLKHHPDDEPIDDDQHDYDHHDDEGDETEMMYNVLKKHLEEVSQQQELRRRQQRAV
ncbi:hypothetical protein BJV82DRAFT_612950 [Fennellomyces sp. T-0311]|nr:hypothetical protein BJV82DRAFT_612950 [Fennellomyces sp. T-0311]